MVATLLRLAKFDSYFFAKKSLQTMTWLHFLPKRRERSKNNLLESRSTLVVQERLTLAWARDILLNESQRGKEAKGHTSRQVVGSSTYSVGRPNRVGQQKWIMRSTPTTVYSKKSFRFESPRCWLSTSLSLIWRRWKREFASVHLSGSEFNSGPPET